MVTCYCFLLFLVYVCDGLTFHVSCWISVVLNWNWLYNCWTSQITLKKVAKKDLFLNHILVPTPPCHWWWLPPFRSSIVWFLRQKIQKWETLFLLNILLHSSCKFWKFNGCFVVGGVVGEKTKKGHQSSCYLDEKFITLLNWALMTSRSDIRQFRFSSGTIVPATGRNRMDLNRLWVMSPNISQNMKVHLQYESPYFCTESHVFLVFRGKLSVSNMKVSIMGNYLQKGPTSSLAKCLVAPALVFPSTSS